MHIDQYPYLSSLLGGYFHQDCYDDGETKSDIIENFKRTTHAYERLGVRADIQRFIHHHRDGLLAAVNQAFEPDVILGKTDEEVQAWLLEVEQMLGE